jgi:protein SCO1
VRRALFAALLLGCAPLAQATIGVLDIQRRVAIEEHLGRLVPLGAQFRDESGARRSLGAILAGRPAIIALVYYDCPNLCSLTLTSLAASLSRQSLRPGRDFEVAAISIDPREGPALAAAKRAAYLSHYASAARCPGCAAGWHFLTGNADAIARLAGALGYRYFWDAAQSQYAHPAGIVVLTPAGGVSQYFNGIDYPPQELRAALLRAGAGHIGSLAQRLWLLCYHYEALAGRYSGQIALLLRVLAMATLASLALLITRLARAHS